ncbi:hypothetical protein DPMN_063048 [Dreissena polymorpha]|uniref:Secreted protein n=1 Tax=Dreissena polymorpha TaxID=45954 RepID=A0A9D4HJS9_DREPO|nr:hypothetical protein DPMN_063048 [Dreissena polymorpha]
MTLLLKICSTVLLAALNPVCSSSSSSSALLFNLLRMMRIITLLGWLLRLMVRLFSHSLRLPFLGRGMTRDWVNSLGHFLSSQIFWQNTVVSAVVASPPCLIRSEGTLSTPGDCSAL